MSGEPLVDALELADDERRHRRVRLPEDRALGFLALFAVILCFSGGSTLVKLSHTPGVTVAFWRMIDRKSVV